MSFEDSTPDFAFLLLPEEATKRVRIILLRLESQRIKKQIKTLDCIRRFFDAIAEPRQFLELLEEELPVKAFTLV
jgi:hypothetical protein